MPVVLRPGTDLDPDALVPHLQEELATFKAPRRFSFTGVPLPRTTSGKVQKFLVRERLDPPRCRPRAPSRPVPDILGSFGPRG
ncbi:hypothetical protein [Amycolatopsis sp. A1MSW2902]|uniref:hypothetical protein n=1 Tax=Amycolatopsis sp. A1MSW2902 TaxID=687413 RepID=UPI00307F9D9F